MNRIGRRTIMCMALIAVGGDQEFARALNQMKEAANWGGPSHKCDNEPRSDQARASMQGKPKQVRAYETTPEPSTRGVVDIT